MRVKKSLVKVSTWVKNNLLYGCVCGCACFGSLKCISWASPKGYLNVVNVFFTLQFRIEWGRNHTTQQNKGHVVGWHLGYKYYRHMLFI